MSARVWRRPAITKWKRSQISHVRASATKKNCVENVELRELWLEWGLMNGPVPYLKGKWSECHRVRNAKRPREGSNSRTVSNYYIDSCPHNQHIYICSSLLPESSSDTGIQLTSRVKIKYASPPWMMFIFLWDQEPHKVLVRHLVVFQTSEDEIEIGMLPPTNERDWMTIFGQQK